MKVAQFLDYLMTIPPSLNAGAFVEKVRIFTRKNGIAINPVGTSNLKIGGPATYRPVSGPRSTCPSTCHFQQGGTAICYATHGHLKAAEIRATDELGASLRAVALALVTAARYDQVARLHVTGDFLKGDRLDLLYLSGVVCLAEEVRAYYNLTRHIAWTYTHVEGKQLEEFLPWRSRLEAAGVAIRISDHWGWGGAVVADHHRVPELKKSTGLHLVKCPAQCAANHSVTCQDCGLCWTHPKMTIVFDVHAQHLDEIRNRSRLKEPQLAAENMTA